MIQKELLLILAAVLLVCSVADLAGAGGRCKRRRCSGHR